jgi:hypothetical protein
MSYGPPALDDIDQMNERQYPDLYTRGHILSYVPTDTAAYGRRALDVPAEFLVSEMLQLGLDPATLIAQERARLRDERYLLTTKAYPLVLWLYARYPQWEAFSDPIDTLPGTVNIYAGDNGWGGLTIDEKDLRGLGFVVTIDEEDTQIPWISDPDDPDFYAHIVAVDTMLYPVDNGTRETHRSRGPPL